MIVHRSAVAALFALTLVVGAPLSIACAQETVTAAPKSAALMSARTIQATASFSVMGKNGSFQPFFDVVITVEKPDRCRIDATPRFSSDGKPKATSFYFDDGKKQYEYNSLISRYRIEDTAKPGERRMSQLTAMAGLNLILNPGAPPRPGVQRTIGEDTADGKKRILITDQEAPRTMKDGSTLTAYNKVWFDPETGLPTRTLEGSVSNGIDRPNLQLEYGKWTFDQPVPPPTFVWTKPEGAEEEGVGLPIGSAAPDFKAAAANGKIVHLSDYKGKIVILDFWATWCGPCQRSMPHLEKVFRQVKDKGVAVLALCVWDEKAEYDRWIAAKKTTFTFPTAFDTGGRANSIASQFYKVTGIPTQYVIDRNGKVAAVFVGYDEGNPALENALRALKVPVGQIAEKQP